MDQNGVEVAVNGALRSLWTNNTFRIKGGDLTLCTNRIDERDNPDVLRNIGDLPVKAGERTAGVGGGKKRMPSRNGTDNPIGGSERMLTYRWSKTERMRCMMSKDNGTSTTLTGEKPIEREGFTWASVNWEQAETTVGRIQSRISKAYRDGKPSLAKRLSYLLVHSFSAKLLAVKRVSEQNKGKNTPGTDGVLWKSNKAKKMRSYH